MIRYGMVEELDNPAKIGQVRLLDKNGGQSGVFHREEQGMPVDTGRAARSARRRPERTGGFSPMARQP
ncbi:MAG: hypothetical protein GMKNLPBB_00865 [Myxococcota bacterium]|nr:hypothetical protein [Myxococcota bacterium]